MASIRDGVQERYGRDARDLLEELAVEPVWTLLAVVGATTSEIIRDRDGTRSARVHGVEPQCGSASPSPSVSDLLKHARLRHSCDRPGPWRLLSSCGRLALRSEALALVLRWER